MFVNYEQHHERQFGGPVRYISSHIIIIKRIQNARIPGKMTMCWAFLNHNNFPSYSIKFLSQNFLCRYAPDCTISSPKMQKLPTVGGGNPPSHTLPPPPSVASRPRAWSLRSLAILCTQFSDFLMLAGMHIFITTGLIQMHFSPRFSVF